jgi:hypothetical protein
MDVIEHTLKTNIYMQNLYAPGLRLTPSIMGGGRTRKCHMVSFLYMVIGSMGYTMSVSAIFLAVACAWLLLPQPNNNMLSSQPVNTMNVMDWCK